MLLKLQYVFLLSCFLHPISRMALLTQLVYLFNCQLIFFCFLSRNFEDSGLPLKVFVRFRFFRRCSIILVECGGSWFTKIFANPLELLGFLTKLFFFLVVDKSFGHCISTVYHS